MSSITRNIFGTINKTINHWYIPLVVGIIFIATGIYTFVSPLESYAALAILFSISFIISGASEIAFSLLNKEVLNNWGWFLVLGILTLIVGVLLFVNPAVSQATLLFYVGFLVLFRSISAVSHSFELKEYGFSNWGYLTAIAVIGIVFSFILLSYYLIILLSNPVLGGMTVVIWTGLALITSGCYSAYLAFKLKKLKDLPNKISNELRSRFNLVSQEINNVLNSKQ